MNHSAADYELLAPAGNWECARAAAANGADAIYFGLNQGFNARARADNFSTEDLPELMTFLHRYGVKGYVTLNTLIFSDELEGAESVVRQLAKARVDAVLVQDLGLVQLIRQTAPELSVHASTQMTQTSAECIAQIESLGIERVVLARELSVKEIRQIRQHTRMPLDAFVHGALCVAYSGQCLTSESLGGRSANRGQCAQACRLPYELVCDGETVELSRQKYLLSPQDLAAYALIPDLMAAGIVSFKIEGRLKTPEYVANITRHYRQAIDAAVAGHPLEFTPRQIEEMELSFSRGFSLGWLKGCDHKALVPATSSAKRGVLLGTVQQIDPDKQRVSLKLQSEVKAGDGLVFSGDRQTASEQGGRVFAVYQKNQRLEQPVRQGIVAVDFYQHSVDLQQLFVGQQVWKNDDPALTARLKKTYSGSIPLPALSLKIQAIAHVGQPLQLEIMADTLGQFSLGSEEPLPAAVKHPLTESVLQEQLSRLGGTGFTLTQLQADIQDNPMIPLSQLGKLRRQMVQQLQDLRETILPTDLPLAPQPVLPELRRQLCYSKVNSGDSHSPPELMVLARTPAQLQSLLNCQGNCQLSDLYADFQDIREYRQAVTMAKAAGVRLWLATPRIQKPGEMGIFKAIAKQQPAGVLVRNLPGLAFFREAGIPCIADFSLNATNELTVDWLLQQGAKRVTLSYDMNQDQLLQLLQQTATNQLEVVVHQHMPMFHMEHCVFCAMLSPGTNKTNCGRPCDRHQVKLRDRVGAEHPLIADVGCRNTLFNKTPQSGAEVVPLLLEEGVRHFRMELLLDEPLPALQQMIGLYQSLLAGQIPAESVWKQLHAMNRVGITRGTLEHDRNPLAII